MKVCKNVCQHETDQRLDRGIGDGTAMRGWHRLPEARFGVRFVFGGL